MCHKEPFSEEGDEVNDGSDVVLISMTLTNSQVTFVPMIVLHMFGSNYDCKTKVSISKTLKTVKQMILVIKRPLFH